MKTHFPASNLPVKIRILALGLSIFAPLLMTHAAPPAGPISGLTAWGESPAPTQAPREGINHRPTGAPIVSSLIYNPDPNGTGIVYSPYADNPDADPAVRKLAENLGKDPIKMYEWVRNNVTTEFYIGGNRGAAMVLLERAGNDVDQCALLGALFKAANYTPTYRLDRVSIPRSAVGVNQAGVYQWLGVEGDEGAFDILTDFWPALDGNERISLNYMWVSIDIPGKGEVRFFPSVKPHSVGRRPNLDGLTQYLWNNAALASGSGSTGSSSNAINSQALKTYLTGLSIHASDTIRNDGDLHNISAAELARVPLIIPEVVSVTAPAALSYPQGIVCTPNASTQALSGIPQSYCGWFKVKAGSAENWFEGPALLGKTVSIEFDGAGTAILRHGGVEIVQSGGGSPSGNIDVEIVYEYPSAYYAGNPPSFSGVRNVLRQDAVAIVYSFGKSVGRLQKVIQDISVKEANSPVTTVTLTDRLQTIGNQYVSQVHETNTMGAAYLDHERIRQMYGGFAYIKSGNPTLSMHLNLAKYRRKSASAPATRSVYSSLGLLMGALEGTAIEQLSGNRSFGTPILFDQGQQLNIGAHYLTTVAQLNSSGITNYSTADIAEFTAILNSGQHLVVLRDKNVSYASQSFMGYYRVSTANWSVATIIGGQKGGVSTGGPGFWSYVAMLFTNPARFVATVFTVKPATSKDPVDLATGAFYKDDVDLTLGNGGEPNSLSFKRHYSSARRYADPTGLGRGWTHNYNIKLDLRSPSDIDSLRASYDEVLPLLIAVRLSQDTINYEPLAARSWLLASTGLTWAVDQQLNSRASITMGSGSVEFVKRPNASYAPVSNLTASLTKLGDNSHNLEFRHGNTLRLRAADGKFQTITDRHGNVLTAAYHPDGRLNTVTDSYARKFTFNYVGTRLSGITDSTGRTVSYGRDGTAFTFTDAEGQTSRYEMTDDFLMTKIVDAKGHTVVENFYDDWQRVDRQRALGDPARESKLWIAPGVGTEVDPHGHKVWTYFDARGRKIFVVNEDNRLAQWRYDGADRLVQTVSFKGLKAAFGYDASHVLTSETKHVVENSVPQEHTRTITPDAEHRPWKVSNFEGKLTEYTYTPEHKVATVTTPGGIVSSFQYDARGRLWKSHPAAYAPSEVIAYGYDDTPTGFGNLDKITYPADANVGDQDFDDYTYNARGDLLQMIDRKDVKVSFEYNNRRQMTKARQWDGATAYLAETVYDQNGEVDYVLDASNRKTSHEYDALGNLLKIKKGPSVAPVTVLENIYDERLLVKQTKDGVGNTTTYAYFPNRQVAYVVDPLGRTTDFGYDADLRLVTVRSPLARASQDANYVTTTTWTDRNWQSAITDANQDSVDSLYDKDGRPRELANRLNQAFTWTYDDDLRKITAKTPLNKTTETLLNVRGLPASFKEASNDTTTFTAYDNEGRLLTKTDGVSGSGGTTFTYWPNGLPKQVAENSKTTSRAYDYANRLSRYEDGEGNAIDYTYYPSGELRTITYPGNKTVTYAYDDFARLRTVTDWSNRVTTYSYDNASRVTRLDRPNGTYRIQEYDAASQLKAFREYKSSGALFAYQGMGYDDDGRLEKLFLHRKQNNGTAHALPAAFTLPSDTLAYDADNRLSTWNGSATTFDEDGNMTSGPLAASTGTAFGNYGYDSRNRLTSAGGSSYRYNPDGLRVAISGTGASTFVIDPNAALSRLLLRTKGGTTTYYVYGYGLLYEETGANTKTYHTNQVGSTLAITDGTQSVTDWIEYAPFGTITYRSGSTDTPFLFNGEAGVQTEANGLYYMRARYYHVRLMRFVNADPIGFSGGLNWYAFGGNNPISFTDPTGLEKQDRANSTGQAQWDSERGLYVMPSVSAVASSRAGYGYVPAPAELIGTRDYYLFRDENAPDSFKRGQGANYYTEYGLKYYDAFQKLKQWAGDDRPELTKFIEQTKITLQVALERALAENPGIGGDRQLLLQAAFDTHPDAYRQGGAGGLSVNDLFVVTWTARGGLWDYPGSSAKQTWESRDWIYQAVQEDFFNYMDKMGSDVSMAGHIRR